MLSSDRDSFKRMRSRSGELLQERPCGEFVSSRERSFRQFVSRKRGRFERQVRERGHFEREVERGITLSLNSIQYELIPDGWLTH